MASKAISTKILQILLPKVGLDIVDNNLAFLVIQNLSPTPFAPMKSREPWSKDSHIFDTELTMIEVRFDHTNIISSNPPHRTIIYVEKG
ncbi:MAG: hypothetical protein KPI85_08025 [cyanobacterium endosymbiont of Epithemia adnata isolate EadnSB Bon19]